MATHIFNPKLFIFMFEASNCIWCNQINTPVTKNRDANNTWNLNINFLLFCKSGLSVLKSNGPKIFPKGIMHPSNMLECNKIFLLYWFILVCFNRIITYNKFHMQQPQKSCNLRANLLFHIKNCIEDHFHKHLSPT